jgi:hypothetical protein
LKIMAGQIEVTEQFCGQLLCGRWLPSIEIATRIFLAHGIPGHEWGLAPNEILSKNSGLRIGVERGDRQYADMPTEKTNQQICTEIERAAQIGPQKLAANAPDEGPPPPARERSPQAGPNPSRPPPAAPAGGGSASRWPKP